MRIRSWRQVGAVGALWLAGASAGWAQRYDPSAALNRKLRAIVLPQIEFRATTLGDAVEFLRQESRRLDLDSDPARRGANILIAGPAARTPVTLSLTRIPLSEALRYLAGQAGLKVRVEPYAVSLVPLGDPSGDLVTAEFRVAPSFFNAAPPPAK